MQQTLALCLVLIVLPPWILACGVAAGLFTGAVVLTLGYMLFMTWLHGEEGKPEQEDDAGDAAARA